MTWSLPRVVVLAPGGLADPAVAVAGARAGGLGVLNGPEAVGALAALRRAIRYQPDGPFGLRLPAEAVDSADLTEAPEGLRVVIVTEPATGNWSRPLAAIRTSGRLALAEVTSRTSARAAAAAGADGLIVAGHEAAGPGGEESSFILLQGVLAQGGPPVWVRGGIGPRVAAACRAAGAAGVVLDGALWLARESPLSPAVRERIERWDGSETIALARPDGGSFRVHAPPGSAGLARLRVAAAEGLTAWDTALRAEVGWGPDQVWAVGQEAALAAGLARRFGTVGGIVQAVERAMDEGPRLARDLRSLAEGAPLAVAQGTRYPLVQGPMTRVSDSVAFAEAVANGGALPFLALALLRGPDVRALLADAAERLAGRSWGVGILGFVPPELRHEQMAALVEARPPFALIAGGRPDQARDLERQGISTYLHAPSPGLLRQFLKDGARHFVLEGRECGGHVGPRSSFVLWEQAAEVVGEAIDREGVAPADVQLLFAGGIHDARAAAMVASLAAPLTARGVKIGVLMGTAYLFTREAVDTGAIVPGFQAEALACGRTTLLETGPGHEVRVAPSPFVADFERERARLAVEGRPAEEVRALLEGMNAGRLRVAAKGVERANGAGSPLISVAPEEQKARGIYMLGQLAALRDGITTIAELHREVATGSGAWLDRMAGPPIIEPAGPEPRPSEIAIVGMAGLFPGAADVRTFWENTLRGVDAITEVPPDRWDWRLYYDPDPKAPDKITSKWGGFLPEIPFDPLRYGMPPTSLPSIEPLHLLTLEVVRSALEDAGYRDRPFPRERTAVILGAGGGAAQLAMGYAFRSYLPLLDTALPGAGREALARCGDLLPEWTEDSFPGILLNVAAGRVANRFNLGGANYTVDAACGSSLAAAALAVRELEVGAADMVVLGGVDTVQNPFTYLAFSKTQAFSLRGRCRPFDASADGIVISEGVAVVILKRLADAERDGDRIYAVLKGLGASSDGRAKGLTAPRPEGQVSALTRAYHQAGIAPNTVGYVEAHGTGTAAGDLAEVQALSEVFSRAGAAKGSCALGSVKSLIGHTKCAAGLAGLINAALALHHQVLPPTIGVTTPNPRARLDEGPFHISGATRPWLHSVSEHPRRAGVSAFGFGGTNFHAVLEAYDRDPTPAPAPFRDWPAELLVWRAPDLSRLVAEVSRLDSALTAGARPALRDLAHTLLTTASAGLDNSSASAPATLALVASSLDDLRGKLGRTLRALADGPGEWSDPTGIWFSARPPLVGSRVAFLFPGQGAQAPNMLADLAVAFPEVRAGIEAFDAALRTQGHEPISPRVFPPPAFDDAGRERQRAGLIPTEMAQLAVGAACLGMIRLLEALGLEPDLVAGHSYGELVALHAAGALTVEGLAALSEARGRLLHKAAGTEPGIMAALAAGPDRVAVAIEGIAGVAPVNWNGPRQTVLSGTREAVDLALERARKLGIRSQVLPVACAFHSPAVASAREPLAAVAGALSLAPPRRPVYSNVTASPYGSDPAAIAPQLGEHVVRPVRFAEMIEAMHAAGARLFLEAGPGATLAPLVNSILGDRPHLAVSCDRPGRPGLPALLHTLGRLVVAGAPLRLERLTAGRSARRLDPIRFEAERGPDPLPPSAWLVDGARARPAHAPEPRRFGSGSALPVSPKPPVAAPTRPGVAEFHQVVPPSPERNGTHSPPQPLPLPLSAPVPVADGSAPVDAGRVVETFQKTMQAFLEVQRSTMLGFLANRPPASTAAPPPGRHLPQSPPQNPAPMGAERNGKHAENHQNHFKFDSSNLKSESPVGRAPEAPVPLVSETRNDGPRSGLDRETVSARLLRIVQERTGYPAEMLRLDLDLEADLGIDSIKRVEILGSLRDAVPDLNWGSNGEAMDALSRARTLGAIVDRVAETAEQSAKAETPAEAEAEAEAETGPDQNGTSEEEASAVRRLVLEEVEVPLPPRAARLAAGVVLVTDEGRRIARNVAADLRALGHLVVRVRHGEPQGEIEGADLTSPDSVAALLDRVRARGPLVGIVHALPLSGGPAAGLDPAAWSARLGLEVRGLFLLARAAAADLETAARRGGACLIAATALGGSFAVAGEPPADVFPGQGGIAGLVKTLAREWSDVRVRVVDMDPRADVEVLAADLVHEVLIEGDRAEVGYRDGRRVAIRAVPAPLPEQVGPGGGFELNPGEPVLITGGARGITAAVALDLARRWRPTLLLIGSGPLPTAEEDSETAALVAPAEIKAVLHTLLRRRWSGREVSPAEVEREYQALRRAREVRANLRALRAAGSEVHYAQVDVRDSETLARVLADWQGRFGPPVGLIHGAGVIQDKLIRDKSPEAFDRVLGIKLQGALTLARLVRPEALRFTAFFSSVAGRFGNRGQSDYAAANDALNKLAGWLDRRWPGRVVSLIWGPWSGVGMVSDLEGHLSRRGLGLIPPDLGRSRLADELRLGAKGQVEVIISSEFGPMEQPEDVGSPSERSAT